MGERIAMEMRPSPLHAWIFLHVQWTASGMIGPSGRAARSPVARDFKEGVEFGSSTKKTEAIPALEQKMMNRFAIWIHAPWIVLLAIGRGGRTARSPVAQLASKQGLVPLCGTAPLGVSHATPAISPHQQNARMCPVPSTASGQLGVSGASARRSAMAASHLGKGRRTFQQPTGDESAKDQRPRRWYAILTAAPWTASLKTGQSGADAPKAVAPETGPLVVCSLLQPNGVVHRVMVELRRWSFVMNSRARWTARGATGPISRFARRRAVAEL
mmetsp:Transcript_6922/g.16446  ORF Transcript_6922/g.16446 Transcript_6922/m.16446 type:complete len:272 (-) Transcript_6922:1219-2034(-)